MSQDNKIKVQIILPEDLVRRIEEDAKKQFHKKSAWFEKLASHYFRELDREGKKSEGRKIIDLDI